MPVPQVCARTRYERQQGNDQAVSVFESMRFDVRFARLRHQAGP